ncbi:MAG: hypothetical protein QG620_275 [Patescibacteria group bacterium]|nr:hypothetical protein [Patescibacteria group bacterium]
MIKIKQAREKPTKGDGARILVDRVWPRGLPKEEAAVDLWLKEIAPSLRLRKWFSHDPKKWTGFREKYFEELALRSKDIEKILRKEKKNRTVTLVYGANEKRFNQAAALKEFLEEKTK